MYVVGIKTDDNFSSESGNCVRLAMSGASDSLEAQMQSTASALVRSAKWPHLTAIRSPSISGRETLYPSRAPS